MATMPIAYDPSRTALRRPERADTVFAHGAPACDEALAAEAARLAYLRAEDIPAEHDRLSAALALAGFGAATLFNHRQTDGQGYGALRSDGVALLAFRGTQPNRIRDLMTDLGVKLHPWDHGAGRVHSGFRATALGLWPQVQAWLAGPACGRKSLLICGHSLGAAIATLMAAPAQAGHVVTLGSPRVGDKDFVAGLEAIPGLVHTRIVNCCDMVTEMPPTLLGFEHCRGMIYIDQNGHIAPDATPSFIIADRLQGRGDYLARYAFRFGALLIRDLADHAPVNYIRAYWP